METMQQVVAGVYGLLRRPSEMKLASQDVRERVHDLLKGYLQDASLEGRQSRIAVAEVQVADDQDGSGSFSFTVPNAEEFEPVRLERAHDVAGGVEWSETQLVPYDAWERHHGRAYAAGSIYFDAAGRARLRLNLTSEQATGARWRLSYRVPLIQAVQMGERPPVPSAFLPMLKYAAAVDCLALVHDDSEEWRRWAEKAGRLYAERAAEFERRWREYLSRSMEPTAVPVRPFNEFRMGGGRRRPRAYLPVGE